MNSEMTDQDFARANQVSRRYIDRTVLLMLVAMVCIFIAGMIVGRAMDHKPALTDRPEQVTSTKVYGRFGEPRWMH